LAVQNGHETIVKLLLEKGAQFDPEGNDSYTPLSWAAQNGYESIIELLLGKGAALGFDF